jgi:hypothetical protein
MQPDDVVHHRRRRVLKAEFPWGGLAETRKRRTPGDQQGRGERRNGYRSEEGRHRRLCSLDGGRERPTRTVNPQNGAILTFDCGGGRNG